MTKGEHGLQLPLRPKGRVTYCQVVGVPDVTVVRRERFPDHVHIREGAELKSPIGRALGKAGEDFEAMDTGQRTSRRQRILKSETDIPLGRGKLEAFHPFITRSRNYEVIE